MNRTVIKPLLVLLILSLGNSCAYVDTKQGEWIFRPTAATWWGARELPSTFVEKLIPVSATAAAAGAKPEHISAWWAPVATSPSGPAPVLLYLHGARWNLSGSITRIPRWNQMGFSVLAIDYRGFGKSAPRTPTEQSANEDAEVAWRYLQTLAPGAKKYIFGHSLGAAIATRLALKFPDADGLILESPFTNIPDMVKASPYGFLPVGALITKRFDNLERIDDVKVPLLIAHGTEDSVVPFQMGERLYAAATAHKRFFRADGGSHHNLTSRFFDDYASAVSEHFALPKTTLATNEGVQATTKTSAQ
jgi:alpha-beta hydrolase superfamily lysophospholipase